MPCVPQRAAKTPAASQLLASYGASKEKSSLSNMLATGASCDAGYADNLTLRSLAPALFSPSVTAAPRATAGGLYGAAGSSCTSQLYTNNNSALQAMMMPAPLRHPLLVGSPGMVASIVGAPAPEAGATGPSSVSCQFTNYHDLANSLRYMQQ
jgi:hypothetical protein